MFANPSSHMASERFFVCFKNFWMLQKFAIKVTVFSEVTLCYLYTKIS